MIKQARAFSQVGLATAVAAVYALPLYIALVNTFKTQQQILTRPLELPSPFTFENLIQALTRPDNLYFGGLMKSVIITTSSVSAVVILGSVIGYYLARHPTRLSQILQLLFLAGLMIPPQIYLIPAVAIFRTVGLIGSLFGLLILYAGGGILSFAVFVFTNFIKAVPRELDEAALLDGAGDLRIFVQIIFPLLRPATATVVIFATLWVWNDFLTPLLILGPSNGLTITSGIYVGLGQIYSMDYGQMFAMMVLASLPLLLLYFILQREFIAGLVGGALKG